MRSSFFFLITTKTASGTHTALIPSVLLLKKFSAPYAANWSILECCQTFQQHFSVRHPILSDNIRNASSFNVPKCRTNIRLFCFQYQGPLFFNSLNPDIKNSTSVASFKNKLYKHLLTYFLPFPLSPPPPFFSFSL